MEPESLPLAPRNEIPQDGGLPARPDRPVDPASEWRGLTRLRDRVEVAAREIERLRTENAALAQRVLALEDARKDGGPALSLDASDPDALRAKVQGFIDTIDRVLREGPPEAGGDGESRTVPDAP